MWNSLLAVQFLIAAGFRVSRAVALPLVEAMWVAPGRRPSQAKYLQANFLKSPSCKSATRLSFAQGKLKYPRFFC